jgi:hypothetical protein
LDEAGFDWNMLSSKLESMFNELLNFKAKHGHINVLKSWPTGLGVWMTLQRKLHKEGKLLTEREKHLK